MATSIYRVINPIVRAVLRSPLHRLLSGNTMLMSLRGRRSGASYCIPVSYMRKGERFVCFTAAGNVWWLNLRGGAMVEVLVAGVSYRATATPDDSGDAQIESALTTFLTAVPRDAGPAGVRLGADGVPDADDIKSVAGTLVLIRVGDVQSVGRSLMDGSDYRTGSHNSPR